MELHEAQPAVRRARAIGEPGRPVVLADTQDNPGAGGNGDTTGILRALIEQDARDAVAGLLIDPASAQRAHDAGLNSALAFSLGGNRASRATRRSRANSRSSASATAASPAPARCSRAST
jgi:microcystin degradation protein MlrC